MPPPEPDRPITDELLAARHNIFDEFSLDRDEETMLGEDEKRKTLPFNGYAEEVAGLYA